MNEIKWVKEMAKGIHTLQIRAQVVLEIHTGHKIAYGHEISSYNGVEKPKSSDFETDLAIIERMSDGSWKPRVVIEAKVNSINTHDAITYSQKAAMHKAVHPYLRYGVMMGNRKAYPLPGRLYRHGAHFDFMISFAGFSPTKSEMTSFRRLLVEEVEASIALERIHYESRKKGRDHYTILHRRLELK